MEREQLKKLLVKQLQNKSESELAELFINNVSAISEYLRLRAGKSAGQKISLLFNPHRLATIAGDSKNSVVSALQLESYIDGLARVFLWKAEAENDLFYQAIQLNVNGVQYVNEFPPALARKIYMHYQVQKDSYVLDPCSGWGGRMLGCSTVCNNYLGFDPSEKTFNGLNKLGEFIQTLNLEFEFCVFNSPFENFELPEKSFDFALTSPPYFDTEQYSNSEFDSAVRYKTFDSWCDLFLLPLVKNTMAALKDNSKFVMNVCDRRYKISEVLYSNLQTTYQIQVVNFNLSGKGGVRKKEGGEVFYEFSK